MINFSLMQFKSVSQGNCTVYIPIADTFCEIMMENKKYRDYLTSRCYSLTFVSEPSMKIYLRETEKEYIFEVFPRRIHVMVRKSKISSLQDIFYIIRSLIELNSLHKNILFLHASSFVKNEKAYVFMAPSGSGKSTIISAVPKQDILSDDIAILKKVNGRFYVFNSPFGRENYPDFPRNRIPLQQLLLIKQASFTKIVEESLEKKIQHIMHNNILFLWFRTQKNGNKQIPKNIENKLYKLTLDLIGSTRIHTLYFTKDLDFISMLRN